MRSNGRGGITLYQGADYATVAFNSVYRNGGAGLALLESSFADVYENRLVKNTREPLGDPERVSSPAVPWALSRAGIFDAARDRGVSERSGICARASARDLLACVRFPLRTAPWVVTPGGGGGVDGRVVAIIRGTVGWLLCSSGALLASPFFPRHFFSWLRLVTFPS